MSISTADSSAVNGVCFADFCPKGCAGTVVMSTILMIDSLSPKDADWGDYQTVIKIFFFWSGRDWEK